MGVTFTTIPSNYEEVLDDARHVVEVAKELGLGKALDVAANHPEAVVIGSDTIVLYDGAQLGKPRDEEHARQLLTKMAGQRNDVVTSIAVVCKDLGVEVVDAITSSVYFKPFNREALETYLQTGDWHDKAGGYGIQSGFAPLIDHIEGDYDSIIGLPTKRLAEMLHQLGIPAQPADVPSSLPQLQAS